MKPYQQFIVVSLTLGGLACWIYVVTQLAADRRQPIVLALFFISLAAWLAGGCSWGLYRFRLAKNNHEVVYTIIVPSVRQGTIVALTVTGLLFLKAIGVMTAWGIALVIAGAVLFELALSRPKPAKRRLWP